MDAKVSPGKMQSCDALQNLAILQARVEKRDRVLGTKNVATRPK